MKYFLLFAPLLLFFLFRLRKKEASPLPFPSEWHQLLLDHVHFYRKLADSKQRLFQKRMMQFLSEVHIDSVQFELEDLDRVLIAASAVIPVFGFPEWQYTNLTGIIVYPDHFNENLEFGDKANERKIAGMVGSGPFEKQMILSRKALHHGFANTTDKNNTAIHEFVHLLDKMDGTIDGIPSQLLAHQYAIPWLKLIHKEMNAIHHQNSDIRGYGGTNEAEFFAVASEYFFERPKLLKRKHPELYAMLHTIFCKKGK
ncbi:M90 family metallopeptidase [Spongiimicrobium salis]|uniref:M90 family metallopeptidase n=1 Tax=Spongiimicrobium salis TaxID=1667022 RepID=UPI00374CB710